jgi:hypothetical protein
MSAKIKAVVVRNFNDAGTERSFDADTEVELTEGEFTNYLKAVLVAPPKGAKGAKDAAASEGSAA